MHTTDCPEGGLFCAELLHALPLEHLLPLSLLRIFGGGHPEVSLLYVENHGGRAKVARLLYALHGGGLPDLLLIRNSRGGRPQAPLLYVENHGGDAKVTRLMDALRSIQASVTYKYV